jgi:hypothetical protein
MTLVELMVTMVIASIVAASTFMFFAGQQRVYETQTKMLNVQQNAWAAMEVLSRFVRAEGSGMFGCVRPVGGIVANPPLNRSNGLSPDDCDGPPVVFGVHNLSQRPNAGLRAYDAVANAMQRIPPLWIVDREDGTDPGIVAGTDIITVAFGNRSSGTNFDSPLFQLFQNTSNPIQVPTNNGAMFQPGEFVVLVGQPGMGGVGPGFASELGCTLLQITSVIGSNPDLLNHASGGALACQPPPSGPCAGSVWNPAGAVAAMIPGVGGYQTVAGGGTSTGVRNFGELWWVRFAIRTEGTAIAGQTHLLPVLTMQRLDGSSANGPQVLAEGIEDLQVAYACDLNADGLLTATANAATDEWKLDEPTNPNEAIPLTNASECNQPSAVRLTLVARSLTEDDGIDKDLTDNGRPAVENHEAHTPNHNFNTGRDQFRRRVLSTTVYPRN